MGNDLFTNPSAQQGESQTKKGARAPANMNATTSPRPAQPDDTEEFDATGEPLLEHKHVGKRAIPYEEIAKKPPRKE